MMVSDWEIRRRRRHHFTFEIQKELLLGQQKGTDESTLKLFSIETVGSSHSNGLVFTVLAEDHERAEELVLEWIKNYGEDSDEIDTVQAVVSRNVRAIINVGTKLFT